MMNSDFLEFSNNSPEQYASTLIAQYIESNKLLQEFLFESGLDDLSNLIDDLEGILREFNTEELVRGSRKFALKEKRQKEINFLDVLKFLKMEGSSVIITLEDNGVNLSSLESYITGEKKITNNKLKNIKHQIACKKEHFVSRDDIFFQLTQKINFLENNNIILFGKEGTGKSTIKDYLKDKISSEYEIQKLEAIELFTEVKSFGEFEEKIKKILEKTKERNKKTILIFDDYHHVANSGIVKNPDIFFNFFKKELKDNLVSFIILVSESYYKEIKNKKYIKRFFNPIEVEDMTHTETKEHIYKRLKDFTDHYKKDLSENQLEYIIENSINYKELSNPEKVAKIIDQLLSYSKEQKTNNLEIDTILSKFGKNNNTLKTHNIDDIKSFIRNKLYGQDEAIETVLDEISIYLAGYKEENKPIGSFLFLGQTGVGKTELANQLKKSLGIEDSHFLRFDMSEFKEKHSTAKIIGAPPGYVGFDSSSSLSDRMNNISDDLNILLFDEIEKAHPEVLDLMLQMMEDGRITDSKGKTANLTKSIIILTSNQGAQTAQEKNIGLSKTNANKSKAKKEILNYFKPELINRLSAKVFFNDITKDNKEILKNITKRHIKEMIYEQRDIEVNIDEDVIDFLINEGYDEKFGARNIKKVIRKFLLKEISLIVLKDKPKKINITLNENKICFKKQS